MRSIILIACATLLLVPKATACDACGCSSGGIGFGLIPFQKRHMIGVNYQYDKYTTFHKALFTSETDQESIDQFQTATLWTRFFVKNRWAITGYIPYKYNSIKTDERVVVHGMGDVKLQVLYAVLQQGDAMALKQTSWYIGSSIGLPTGKIDAETKQNLPLIQPGISSFIGEVNSQFSHRNKNLGINIELNGTSNKPIATTYKFGSQLSGKQVAFYRIKRPKTTWIPEVGIAQFFKAKDYLKPNSINNLSGSQLLTAVIGTSFYKELWGLRGFYQFPIYNKISSGISQPNNLFNIQLIHLITIKKQKNENK